MSRFLKRVLSAGLIVLVIALSKLGLADLAAKAPVMRCADLVKADLSGVADKPIHITSATEVKDGKSAPYCQVLGYVEPQVKFEVRLPLRGWTERFLQTGCGGLCGEVDIDVHNDRNCSPSENGELALASTDMGHSTRGGAFGADHQLRIDFAYRGVHVTALAAKALIEKYYGQKPRYSYFAGCSDGGREALMEAQRYPKDFNGITAGAPVMNFITQNTFYHGWNARVNTDANGKAILTAEKLPILHQGVVDSCDAVDGLKDGLIADPRACRFDPAAVQCKTDQNPATCLSAEQVDTARKLYRGAHDASERQLVISGPQVGSELSWVGVYVPKTPEGNVMSRRISMDVITGLTYDKPLPANYTLNDFRFDQKTFEELKPMHAIYDTTNPDLGEFSSAGGKLIIWHGWSDAHISPLNTVAYYRAMKELMGEEKVKAFAQLYLFPGGYHCGGGDGPFDFDVLSAIMAWVETGRAPHKLIAYHRPGGPPGAKPLTEDHADRSRPVFPYPLISRYTGKGSIDDASSFVAEMPKEQLPEKFDWLGSSFFTPY